MPFKLDRSLYLVRLLLNTKPPRPCQNGISNVLTFNVDTVMIRHFYLLAVSMRNNKKIKYEQYVKKCFKRDITAHMFHLR